MDNRKLLAIKIFGVIIVFFIAITVFMICKTIIDNESVSPFVITKMQIISTVEGETKEGANLWNFNLIQKNDIYISVEKNDTYEHEEQLKNVNIEGKEISSSSASALPDVGTINFSYISNIRRISYR